MTDLDAIRGLVERMQWLGRYCPAMVQKERDDCLQAAALLAVIDGLAKALEECAAPIPGFMGKSSDDILTAVLVEFRRRTEQARAQLAALARKPATTSEAKPGNWIDKFTDDIL